MQCSLHGFYLKKLQIYSFRKKLQGNKNIEDFAGAIKLNVSLFVFYNLLKFIISYMTHSINKILRTLLNCTGHNLVKKIFH